MLLSISKNKNKKLSSLQCGEYHRNYLYAAAHKLGLSTFWIAPPETIVATTGEIELNSHLDRTTYLFPANTLTEPTEITHTAQFHDNVPKATHTVGIHHFFEIRK